MVNIYDARSIYLESRKLIDGLVNIETNYADPPAALVESEVYALRGSTILLTVASFENYIKEFGEEQAARLKGGKKRIRLSQLPERIQIHSVFHSLKIGMDGLPHGKKGKKIDRISTIKDKCSLIIGDQIDSEIFSITYGNPNSERLAEIFLSFNVDDIFRKIKVKFEDIYGSPVADDFIKDKLDSLIGKRNEIAHTASVRTITRVDVKEYIKFVDSLVDTLNVYVANEIDAILRGI